MTASAYFKVQLFSLRFCNCKKIQPSFCSIKRVSFAGEYTFTMASQTNQLENIYNENVAIDDAKFKEQRGLISSLVRDTLIPQVMDKFTYLSQACFLDICSKTQGEKN